MWPLILLLVYSSHALAFFIPIAGSTARPDFVPVEDVSDFSQAAGLAQQTYCQSNPEGLQIGDSTLLWTFGDGRSVQRTNVYRSESLGVVLAYQGTNSMSLLSILNDVRILLVDPDSRYRAALPRNAKVHNGFQKALLRSADRVEEVVMSALEDNPEQLTVVGHSLGAAIALLGGVWWRHLLSTRSPSTQVRIIVFGLPRTGNKAFVDGVDRLFPPNTIQPWRSRKYASNYIVNGQDWVPHVPPQSFGALRGNYRQPSGQIWINPANSTGWLQYPGQENVFGANSAKTQFPVFYDHQGIYFHTQIGASQGHCPATVGQD